MTTPDGLRDAPFELSLQARDEVAMAIAAYFSPRSTDGEGQLRHASVRVAAEANHVGASAEQMLLAVEHIFEREPRSVGDVQQAGDAQEKFARWCVELYIADHDDAD